MEETAWRGYLFSGLVVRSDVGNRPPHFFLAIRGLNWIAAFHSTMPPSISSGNPGSAVRWQDTPSDEHPASFSVAGNSSAVI